MIETNVRGLVTPTRHVLPDMVARGSGHVINPARSPAKPHTRAATFTARLKPSLSSSRAICALISPAPACGPPILRRDCAVERSCNVRLGDDDAAEKVYAGTTPLTAEDTAASTGSPRCHHTFNVNHLN